MARAAFVLSTWPRRSSFPGLKAPRPPKDPQRFEASAKELVMRHLDAFRGPLSAFAAVSALLLVLLGAVGAPAEADTLDATGTGTAIGAPTSDPNIYTVTVIAAGHSPLLGDFRVRAHHFTDLSAVTFLDGAITFEGAHGRLFGTYVGTELQTEPDTLTIEGTV